MKYYIVKRKRKNEPLYFKAFKNARLARQHVRWARLECEECNDWASDREGLICTCKGYSIHEVTEKLIQKGFKNV